MMLTKKLLVGLVIMLSASFSIWADSMGNHELYMFLKPLTTVLIIIFSLVFGKKNTRFFKFVVAALCFCLLGDTLLLFDAYFIWGLVAFLIAHILFALSFVSQGGFKYYWLALIPLLVFGIWYYWNLYEVLEGLKIPVLLYFTIIILMSWQGVNLLIWKKKSVFVILFAAVCLFLISDSILAWSKFKSGFHYSGILILASYWTSIFLIALATSSNQLEGVVPEERQS